MTLEQHLTDELRDRAEECSATDPPLDQLLDRGRAARARRQRGIVAVSVAAVVVVVALAIGLPTVGAGRNVQPVGQPSSTPTPSSSAVPTPKTLGALPVGEAPRTAYLDDGALHALGRTVRTRADRLLVGGSSVLVSRGTDRAPRWSIFNVTGLRQVRALDGVAAPVVSPVSDLVVWTSHPTDRTTRITAWDPATRRAVAHVDLAAPYAPCCGGGEDVTVLGIDAGSNVYYTRSGPGPHDYVWRPGHGQPVPLRVPLPVVGIAPPGPVLQAGGTSGLYGHVDPSGRFHRDGALPTDQRAAWSPDASLVAYAGDDTGAVPTKQTPTVAWVLDLASGRRTRMLLPRNIYATPVAFESDDTVLFEAEPQHPLRNRTRYVVRCRVQDGSCERALDLGTADGWVLGGP